MATVLQLYVANIKEFVRDRAALFWTLAFPLLFIILFGVIFAGPSAPNYTVGLVNQDNGPIGASLVDAFKRIDAFKIKEGSEQRQVGDLKKGQVDMVVVIPAGASEAVRANRTAGVRVYYDPSNTTDSQIKLSIVQEVLTRFNQSVTQVNPPLALEPRTTSTTTFSAVDFLVPGILAMALMQLGLFATATPLVQLRQEGVLRRLGATPLPRWTVLVSQVLLRLTIGLVQAALILGLGFAVFGVKMQGNPLVLFGLIVLGALSFIAMGYLIASVSRTVEAASGISTAVNFPMMFLSGIFFPISVLPVFLTPVVRALPLTYLGDAIRQVMVGGVPEFPIMVDVAVMAAWTAVCALLSIRLFRWE